MRNLYILLTLGLAFITSSCSSTLFYQVYKTSGTLNYNKNSNDFYYEDENCIVSYDLWSEEGNAGFQFYNKTDQIIYLDLSKSFFILNGIAYDYFQNRVFSNSTNLTSESSVRLTGVNYLNLIQSTSYSVVGTRGASTAIAEKDIIAIPAKTSKIISEFKITGERIRNCNLYQYPTKNQIKTDYFSRTDSPLVFSNRIVYRKMDSEEPIHFENEFYVSEITNYPSKEIILSVRDEFCGEKSMSRRNYNKEYAPDKFYVKYAKGKSTQLKH